MMQIIPHKRYKIASGSHQHRGSDICDFFRRDHLHALQIFMIAAATAPAGDAGDASGLDETVAFSDGAGAARVSGAEESNDARAYGGRQVEGSGISAHQ
jgi:hypothetical protein